MELLRLTLRKVEMGRGVGPITPEVLSWWLGSRWVACRRFPVKQGVKAYMVDDSSEAFIHQIVILRERVPRQEV